MLSAYLILNGFSDAGTV